MVKLAPKQILGFLKAPMKDCIGVLVYGADEGQAREHAEALTKTVIKDPTDPFSTAEISEDALKSLPSCLADELFAMNMIGGKRLVRLNTSSESTGKILSEIYASTPLPEAYLLVMAGELSSRSALRILFETHPNLAAMPCYRDEGYQIEGLIGQRFREASIRLDSGVLEYLATNLGNDRRVSRMEIEKIILYLGDEKHLTHEQATSLIGNNAELTMDDLCLAIADGNVRGVEKILHILLNEAMQPVQITRAIQRYFQRLHWLKAQMHQKRLTAEQAIAEIKPKIFYKLAPLLARQLHLWSAPVLEQAMALLTQAEQSIKETGTAADLYIEHYVVQLMILGSRSRKTT